MRGYIGWTRIRMPSVGCIYRSTTKNLSNSQFWKTKSALKLTEFFLRNHCCWLFRSGKKAVKYALVTVAINPNMNTAEPRKDAAMCFQADQDHIFTTNWQNLGGIVQNVRLSVRPKDVNDTRTIDWNILRNMGCKKIVLKLKPFDAQLFYGRLTETAKEYAFQWSAHDFKW